MGSFEPSEKLTFTKVDNPFPYSWRKNIKSQITKDDAKKEIYYFEEYEPKVYRFFRAEPSSSQLRQKSKYEKSTQALEEAANIEI